MIAAWMLFVVLVGLLSGAAALAAERAAAAMRLPRRIIWAAALAASVGVPAIALTRSIAGAAAPLATAVLPAMQVNVGLSHLGGVGHPGSRSVDALDAALLASWLVLSAVLLGRLALAMATLKRRRGLWRPALLDGAKVRFSNDVGPAVVGIRRAEIVLPEWITDLDAPLRALVLRHEDEHRRARDPLLLLIAAVAAALMPWNLALLWQSRRLRLAVEMDCDARVLERHPQAERYGLLLLTIAQRRSAMPSLLAPALSEPSSHLERRIAAMRDAAIRISRTKLALLVGLAGTAIAVACSVEAPVSASGARAADAAGRFATAVKTNEPYFEFQVEKTVAQVPGTGAPRYPDLLRQAHVQGEVLVQFVVDTAGRAEPGTIKVLRSTHDLFANSVVAALPDERFTPAEVGGRKVKQLVQMPFVFSLRRR